LTITNNKKTKARMLNPTVSGSPPCTGAKSLLDNPRIVEFGEKPFNLKFAVK